MFVLFQFKSKLSIWVVGVHFFIIMGVCLQHISSSYIDKGVNFGKTSSSNHVKEMFASNGPSGEPIATPSFWIEIFSLNLRSTSFVHRYKISPGMFWGIDILIFFLGKLSTKSVYKSSSKEVCVYVQKKFTLYLMKRFTYKTVEFQWILFCFNETELLSSKYSVSFWIRKEQTNNISRCSC